MRIPAWKTGLAAGLFLAVVVTGGAAEELRLRCRWTSPNDRSPLDIAYLGNPLVVMLPGQNLEARVDSPLADARVTVLKNGQPHRADSVLHFTAPEKPGAFFIPLVLSADGAEKERELCVVVPFRGIGKRADKGYELNADGQRIGHYRLPDHSGNAKVRANPDSYQPPVWWFRIDDHNRGFEIMPGLTAGELVVPSEDTGLPHTDIVPVHYPMWRTIRTLRQALRERLDIPPTALKLISMFRAPPYNRSVGSNAFGRHIYGDAFDFYIDLEGGGKASDLNRDGKRDRRDAYVIVALIEDLQAEGKIPMGGIGVYNSPSGDHEVTMHLDLRGHRATWGYLYSASGKRSEFSWQSRRFADLDRRDEAAAAARAAKEDRKYARPRREPLP